MRIRVRRTCLALIAIALMVPTVQACTHSAAVLASGQQASSNLGADGGDPEALLPTPLQAYRLTPRELATVGYARGILIDRCMQRFDLSYPQLPYSEVLQAALVSERIAIGRLYGITDPGAAAAYGYGFPPDSSDTSLPGDRLRDRDYLNVLHGNLDPRNREPGPATFRGVHIPSGGCAGEGDRKIGQVDKDTSLYGLAHTLWIHGQAELPASQGYRKVISEWGACMATRGFHVTDPVADQGAIAAIYAARQMANDEALTGQPVSGEAALATADVACKRSVHLVERLDALGAVIDRRTIDVNRPVLRRDRRRLDRQVRLATTLLRESGQ